MVFEAGRRPGASCVLCRTTVRPGETGSIAIQQQLLTFTQRYAIDLLVEVLSIKRAALDAWRWMCASCYAQMELLDKYEQDRRVLEKRTAVLRAELVAMHSTGKEIWPTDEEARPMQAGDAGGEIADPEAASNGAESDPENDNYVEVKVENIAAVSWPVDGTNGDLDVDVVDGDIDDSTCQPNAGVDEDPLADVTDARDRASSPESRGSPASVIAVGESSVDPLADDGDVMLASIPEDGKPSTLSSVDVSGLTYVGEIKGVKLGGDAVSILPTIDVSRLQYSVQRSLRAAADSPSASVADSAVNNAGKRPAASDPDLAAPPAKLPASSGRFGLKALLPKLPQIPQPTAAATPVSSAAEGQLQDASQQPLLLQSVDGQLYMLPPGAPAAVPAPPLTLLRLPDGRIVMPAGTAQQVSGKGAADTTMPAPPPRGPGSGADSSATSTLKNLLLGQQTTASRASSVPSVVSTTAPTCSVRAVILEPAARPGNPSTPPVPRPAVPKPPQAPAPPPLQQSSIQNSAALTPAAASRMGLRLAAEPCPLCSLIFGSRELVDRHLRSHTMVCSSCDLLFASRLGLFEHRQVCTKAQEAPPMPPVPVHLVDKGLTCNLCGAMVSQPILMNEHASREHGLLYRCPKCDCTTAVLREYLHHVRESHGLDSPHPCNLCQTSFSKRDTQRRHFENKHSVAVERPMTKDRTIDGVRLKDVREEVEKSMVIVKEEEDVNL